MAVLRREKGLDEILIQIDPSPEISRECYPDLVQRMESQLRIGLGIRVGVEIVRPGSLPRWDHKAKRFRDEREEVPF